MVKMTEKYFCVHGHFYQPPRENPWLETVEREASAAPYHDWNERITDECYAANLAARILNDDNEITAIVNNYSQLNFNFGPTLLGWLEASHPEVHEAITASDRENAARYNGHGPAIAQGYNHIIMPLANRRDKETQVAWGISDFQYRFGRAPEGMWLPETAVDLETLEIMASRGIKYTILAPHQAARFRAPGGSWEPLPDGISDTSRLYRCPLPSGNTINICFYHFGLSSEVAFGEVLKNGDLFTRRVLDSYQDSPEPQLITIAADGETYGHHHRFGEMALAYTFDRLRQSGVRVTTIGEFLALYPPQYEVEIKENTSWSCAHGIERWRSGCCCATGGHPGWNQHWRHPLRQAMNLLRDRLEPKFETEAGQLLVDPWAARDDYQPIIARRDGTAAASFLKRWGRKPLSTAEKIRVFKLMELQRGLMSCFTSCGWFFDDIGGLESVLVLKQAGRVLQLSSQLFGESPEGEFLEILSGARSNRPELGSGRDIYLRNVPPLVADMARVAAHFALSCFLENYRQHNQIFVFSIKNHNLKLFNSNRSRLAAGDITVTSRVTGEQQRFVFAAIFHDKHDLKAGIAPFERNYQFAVLSRELQQLAADDERDEMEYVDKTFPDRVYGPDDLFTDERGKILDHIIAGTLSEAEESYRELYRHYQPLMAYLSGLGQPIPPQLSAAAEFVLQADLSSLLADKIPDLETAGKLLLEASAWNISLDRDELGFHLATRLEELLSESLPSAPESDRLLYITRLLQLFRNADITPDLWRAQNIFYNLATGVFPDSRDKPEHAAWTEAFRQLGRLLGVSTG